MTTYWPVLVLLLVLGLWVLRACWLLWPPHNEVSARWVEDNHYDRDGDRRSFE